MSLFKFKSLVPFIKITTLSNFKSKRHEASGNELVESLVDYSKAPCIGADQKARELLERDWRFSPSSRVASM